jgi:uncharacterized protein (DUF58 family)
MARKPTTRNQKPETKNYLDPVFLSHLTSLELVARCMVEGFFSGIHPSPFHGFSVEYSDHREYVVGDELKFVDWKVYGRTDKLYIKQFQQETNTTVYLLLDSSQSMAFHDVGAVSKLDYASYLAAALTHMMLKQADSVSLLCFADSVLNQVPASSRRTQLNAVLTGLQANRAQGQTRLADILHQVAELTKRRGLIILFSDLLDDQQDIFDGLAHLKYLQHDVLVFQILDHQELTLDYDGAIQFEDMESADKIRVNAPSLRAAYQHRVQAFLKEIQKTLGNSAMEYCLCDTSLPMDRAMMAYLAKRRRLK